MSELAVRRRPAGRVRAVDEGEGIVEAYVSVFDVEYRVGPWGQREIIKPGAFAESISEKSVLPHFWSHNWPFGLMVGDSHPEEDDHGVKTIVNLDMDDELGRRLFRRHKSGAVDEFSIGYIPTAFEVDPDDEDLEIVTRAQLIETSSVLLGANPETELIDVRSRSRGGIVTPVLVAGAGGALEVQWVPAKETPPDDKPAGDRDTTGGETVTVSSDTTPIVVNVTVNTAHANGDPPKPERHDAAPLLREPAFRDAVRERLSSPTVGSGS